MTVQDIHKELKLYNDLERTKIGIEFFVANIKKTHRTCTELQEVQKYFNNQLFPDIEWNQTS